MYAAFTKCVTLAAPPSQQLLTLLLPLLQAEKLASLGGLGKEKSAKTLAESEKLLADTVKHCEEMVAGATTALEGMRSRCELIVVMWVQFG